MSIVVAALDQCEKGWICHRCTPQGTCSGNVSRGAGTLVGLLLDTPKPHVVVDLDSVLCMKEKERCDLLCFVDDRARKKQWFVPIEVSYGKHKDAKKVFRQLQMSADIVGRKLGYSGDVELLPVFVGCSGDSKKMRNMKVQYKGKKTWIKVLRIGDKINNEMNKRQ